jgi:alpha-L-rhamnosidase
MKQFVACTSLLLLLGSAVENVAAQPSALLANLRVEHRVEPTGIDVPIPRFSWKLIGSRSGLRQTAYHIQVSQGGSDEGAWDSGWVESDRSHLVSYAGTPLSSSTDYNWRVRIRDEAGVESPWSESARFVSGLLEVEKEFEAKWIGLDEQCPGTPHGDDWFSLDQADWIWHSKQIAKRDSVVDYRGNFDVPADTANVMVAMECNFTGQLSINGVTLLQGGRMGLPSYLDVTPWIQPGRNRIAVHVNECDHRDHSGLIVEMRIEKSDGTISRSHTDAQWECKREGERRWSPVRVLGRPGEKNSTKQGKPTLHTPKFGSKVFSPPAVYLRNEIELTKPVRFAVMHGTAQGLFDLHINGTRITKAGFQPGWTQYEEHTSYVSFDVTDTLQQGSNALGAILGDGWFRGNLLWAGRERFGNRLRFAGQLEVEYEDGTRQTFVTDDSWKASFGPIMQSDIMNGEVYDARREQTGWSATGFDDAGWHATTQSGPQLDGFHLRAHRTEPVQPEMELTPQAITQPAPGIYVVDFGQNFAGWTRLKVRGKPGQVIYLRFGEDLNPDGTVYTANLRGINPADRYICNGRGQEVWEPTFTYHGFRFVEVHGLQQAPTEETLTGIVAHSGGPITSSFDSSSAMLNRLYKNIQWSQRSNYFETMTDCPQRDERYGWTGDAWFFLASSAYNQNAASFFHKWFEDCVDTQNPKSGNISNGAPGNKPGAGNASLDWSAAMMATPWMLWQRYGDTRAIESRYAELRLYMTQWEKLIDQLSDRPVRGTRGKYKIIGDWVSIEKGTSKEFVGRVLGWKLSRMMVDFAGIVGNTEDEKTFAALAQRYRDQILDLHLQANGKVTGDTQCAYAYLARLGLFEPTQEKKLREQFHKRIVTDQFTVRTGFHGTRQLLQGLTEIGLIDDAARTILNEQGPGWGAMVKRGATTIWEHWDGKKADGSFYPPKMNSFNHYTFGGCGEWMMGYLVGLRPESPGFKTIRVQPVIIPGLDFAEGSFETPYGTVSNRWQRDGDSIQMEVIVPPNSDGRVIVPNGETKVGSGKHQFTWKQIELERLHE